MQARLSSGRNRLCVMNRKQFLCDAAQMQIIFNSLWCNHFTWEGAPAFYGFQHRSEVGPRPLTWAEGPFAFLSSSPFEHIGCTFTSCSCPQELTDAWDLQALSEGLRLVFRGMFAGEEDLQPTGFKMPISERYSALSPLHWARRPVVTNHPSFQREDQDEKGMFVNRATVFWVKMVNNEIITAPLSTAAV